MLKAIASLRSYHHFVLDRSLYLMTVMAAAGYFSVIGAANLLDRLGAYADRLSQNTEAKSFKLPGALISSFLGAIANERWIWITPLVVVLTLYLSVIFQPGQAETGPMMYALF
jgi:hypothetical protein